jgi:hypothetical protein
MDWETIVPSVADGATTIGLLVLLFVGLAKGWIVTRREAETYRENEAIWRDAYNAKSAADNITREQFNELLESSKTTRAFIESFMKAVERP